MSVARITPLTPVVDLSRRRGQVRFRSDLRDSARHVFAVDLYSHLREKHPDTHVGYWVFALPEGEAETTIGIDLTRISPGSLWKETAAGREAALDSWSAGARSRASASAKTGARPARKSGLRAAGRPTAAFRIHSTRSA